jgi:hypothetical protein
MSSNPSIAAWQADVSRAWLLAVMEAYEALRQQHPEVAALRRPHFCLDDRLERTLGQWHTSTRRLTLAAQLFTNCDWAQVLATLHHEVAHQLVAEHYGVRHEPPHGPTFHRACALLGIHPEATARLALVPGGQHRVVERVHKLLALGASPNRHEAELALAKAHELMLKYNLETVLGPAGQQYAFRMLGPLYRRTPSSVWEIMSLLGEFYFVEYIGRPFCDFAAPPPRQVYRVIELYGTPPNLDMAEYVYYFLLHQAEVQWQEFRAAQGLSGTRQRLSFLRGLFQGVRTRLRAERTHLAHDLALVWRGDPQLVRYFRERNPQVRHTAHRLHFYAGAHEAGRQAGEQLRIRPGLTGQATGPGGARRLLSG